MYTIEQLREKIIATLDGVKRGNTPGVYNAIQSEAGKRSMCEWICTIVINNDCTISDAIVIIENDLNPVE